MNILLIGEEVDSVTTCPVSKLVIVKAGTGGRKELAFIELMLNADRFHLSHL